MQDLHERLVDHDEQDMQASAHVLLLLPTVSKQTPWKPKLALSRLQDRRRVRGVRCAHLLLSDSSMALIDE